ncbi:hypothetical protein FRX31_033105 [Thalictrum thalictroides]|uniref:Uncharacterized protein n=1 Tax=Thalictrum thalictroides TaxID=46969 RepID=A0A7J6UXK8_THATH|nr:hypothetical protein FRX31_033105 [Thalictrum thalictroides]
MYNVQHHSVQPNREMYNIRSNDMQPIPELCSIQKFLATKPSSSLPTFSNALKQAVVLFLADRRRRSSIETNKLSYCISVARVALTGIFGIPPF